MPNKVAIYTRVSTQEQAQEGYSIDEQITRLTAYCQAQMWAIAKIYKDPGFSGANLNRPAMQKLLEDIDDKMVDCVLVYKLDRLSRSQKDTLYLIEDVFDKNGIVFVSMQESFDTGKPIGKATVGLLSVFAQLEREQIKERMAMGMVGRAKAGLWHGGGVTRPFGYDYIDGRLVVNKMEAVIVHDIYEMFLQRTPLFKIHSILKEKYGRDINHTQIHRILSRPIYTGVISWLGETYPGQHEPLIDEETFQKAQMLMNDRARISATKPAPFRATHLLTGFLVCGNCGARYFARRNFSTNGKPLRYYCCYSRAKHKRFSTTDNCKNPTYRVERLDRKIVSEILRLVDDKAYFQSVADNSVAENISRIEEKKAALAKEIHAIDGQISRIIDLYQVGGIDLQQIGERTQELQAKKDALKKTLKSIAESKSEKLTQDDARNVLDDFRVVMTNGSLEEKRNILQELIRQIVLYPDKGHIDIIWNF